MTPGDNLSYFFPFVGALHEILSNALKFVLEFHGHNIAYPTRKQLVNHSEITTIDSFSLLFSIPYLFIGITIMYFCRTLTDGNIYISMSSF